MSAQHLGDLCADPHHRVQSAGGVLWDQRNVPAPNFRKVPLGGGQEIAAVEKNLTVTFRCSRKQSYDCLAQSSLSRTRFSKNPDDFAGHNAQVGSVESQSRRAAPREIAHA